MSLISGQWVSNIPVVMGNGTRGDVRNLKVYLIGTHVVNSTGISIQKGRSRRSSVFSFVNLKYCGKINSRTPAQIIVSTHVPLAIRHELGSLVAKNLEVFNSNVYSPINLFGCSAGIRRRMALVHVGTFIPQNVRHKISLGKSVLFGELKSDQVIVSCTQFNIHDDVDVIGEIVDIELVGTNLCKYNLAVRRFMSTTPYLQGTVRVQDINLQSPKDVCRQVYESYLRENDNGYYATTPNGFKHYTYRVNYTEIIEEKLLRENLSDILIAESNMKSIHLVDELYMDVLIDDVENVKQHYYEQTIEALPFNTDKRKLIVQEVNDA